jgi:type II secretory pathway component PulL
MTTMMMMMQTAPTSSSDDGVPVAVTKKVADDHSAECGQELANLAAITPAENVQIAAARRRRRRRLI